MAARPIPQSYDGAQRAFHWIMAALILLAIVIGVTVSLLPRGEPRAALLALHKSLGMTALVLGVLRIGYRSIAGAPPYAEALTPLNRAAAHAAHLALYALMIALPVGGYVNSAAGGKEPTWFGLFVWPAIIPQDKALAHLAGQAHYWLAWSIGAVLAFHVAGPRGIAGSSATKSSRACGPATPRSRAKAGAAEALAGTCFRLRGFCARIFF
jgi:cytochrome b561